MSVNAADVVELRRLEATAPDSGSDLSALETIPAVFGFVIANSRAEGGDEVDQCELLARFSGMTAPETRDVARVLKALGYRAASDRLRRIAGRTRRDLRPLV